ncbi:alpha/beta fold hydrolase [Nocardia harenae]|uniref:alpha/beta fold hydrolase n=1 Tax=Nocardia harenae TaxID=358707 RepID=UPI00082A09E7|nr:alpha/beta hydrolase [Nocardia harenae]
MVNRDTFDLGDVTLHALTWGAPGAPLALCLHGYPDTAWTWRHLGPELAARGFHVVAPFSRGYAPSEMPADGDLSTGARVADALAIAARIGAPEAVLIGHDWGGCTATALAALDGTPFRAVVSLAVPPFASITPARDNLVPHLAQTLAQSRNSWYVLANQLPALPERAFVRLTAFLWRTWSPGYDATEDLAHLAAATPTRAHRAAATDYYRFLLRRRARSPRNRELDRLLLAEPRHPLLVLHGGTDGCLRPGLFRGLERRLPAGSRVVTVEGAGHFLHLEQPALVNRLIIEHLTAG